MSTQTNATMEEEAADIRQGTEPVAFLCCTYRKFPMAASSDAPWITSAVKALPHCQLAEGVTSAPERKGQENDRRLKFGSTRNRP